MFWLKSSCFPHQVPKIEESERSMHLLLKQRADGLVQRRQDDVQDCSADFLNAQSGNKSGLEKLSQC